MKQKWTHRKTSLARIKENLVAKEWGREGGVEGGEKGNLKKRGTVEVTKA